MGKVARQATRFALLGLLATLLGMMAKLEAEARRTARMEAAQAVHARDYQLQGGGQVQVAEPSNAVVVITLDDGTILHVRECPKFDPKTAYESAGRLMAALETRTRQQSGNSQPSYNARPRNDSATHKPDESLDCRNFSSTTTDRATLERDYWVAYRESKQQSLADNTADSLRKGLFGLPAGLVVWIFYRLVLLAIRRQSKPDLRSA
jgi:hypothetical protein